MLDFTVQPSTAPKSAILLAAVWIINFSLTRCKSNGYQVLPADDYFSSFIRIYSIRILRLIIVGFGIIQE